MNMAQPVDLAKEKNLKVPPEIHREIAHASIDMELPMYTLVARAWEAYKRELQSQHVQALRQKSSARISVPDPMISGVEVFLAWLSTPPANADLADMRKLVLMHLKIDDPLTAERQVRSKRKDVG
jgi:hypothetical protein